MRTLLYNKDCLEGMKKIPSNIVDLIVTDPPYSISFMQAKWDKALPSIDIWKECLRVLKEGAFAFVMCIPRQDCLSKMILLLGEAGFKISYTSLYYCFASGFPKAANVGKIVDRGMGMSREADNIPVSPQAQALDGSYVGFQPKPALEYILCVKKPLTTQAELTIITSQTITLMEEVLSWYDVNSVVKNSDLNLKLKDYIAQRLAMGDLVEEAKVHVGKVGKSFGLIDMLKSTLDELITKPNINLSIGLLWKSILVDLLSQGSKFTISMITEQITELKTLNLLLSQVISANSIHANVTHQNGMRLNVTVVESYLTSLLTRLLSLNPTGVLMTVGDNIKAENGQLPVNNVISNSRSEVEVLKENFAHGLVIKHPETLTILIAQKPITTKYKRSDLYSILNEEQDYWYTGRTVVTNINKEQLEQKWDTEFEEGDVIERRIALHPDLKDEVIVNRESLEKTFPFLITPKPSKREKNEGLEELPEKQMYKCDNSAESLEIFGTTDGGRKPRQNIHPTVKPVKLMSWLITLGSKEGDLVLDPFMGSGTTGIAAQLLSRHFLGFELNEEYFEIAKMRLRRKKGDD